MTPKDKGMLRELLDEYGPSVVIQAIAKQGYWADGGQVFLLKQAGKIDADHMVIVANQRDLDFDRPGE